METKYKNYMMMVIVEDYLVHHGNEKPTWTEDFYSLPCSVISCLGDLAELFCIKQGYGKSRARTLWDRLVKNYHNADNLPF